ncbi:NUDIX hydrolase [Caldicellulosiruptor saccharolyticus DSM 8903]|uniref:NUDIX hydrolase n=1 Tax=Caldicellulosiruptor saccharolyticus (strain ATCC 43494 / DSM 8903 / Tp8T 6331) TaxID=351627 RepID=A4XKD2_CALS8|nr:MULTISPECIES: NUDIX hydrolase [Caldicellulosiruptor]ABP67367.2 NUDIX hydrolase [Caldicellulosiruptor saccharolyticus DSM 8903]
MSNLKVRLPSMFDLSEIDVSRDLIEKKIDIEIETQEFFEYVNSKINVDRIGEVVFAVKNGDFILLVRQDEYPQGLYRVPSGGIGIGEKVVDALKREVKEELGIDVQKFSLIGVIEYNLCYKHKSYKFFSFVFLIDDYKKDSFAETDGEISEVLPVEVPRIKDYCDIIEQQSGFWKDWARLRYHSTYLVYEYLTQKRIK